MTDSEVLLVINSVLQKYQTKVVKAGPKVDKIRIIAKQRAEAQDLISKELRKNKVSFVNEIDKSESSFPVTKIQLEKSKSVIKLIYKKGSGGGSGAGAAVTKLAESAQALYAALAFNVLNRQITNKDLTKDNFKKALQTADTDEKFEKIINDLPDDWIESSIAGANALYREFGGKGKFIFHRGSKTVNIIENTFTEINRKEKAFGNLNKWSPADIYMISDIKSVRDISEEKTLKGLNEKMFESIQKNKVIGVSLKKNESGKAKLSKKNFLTDKKIISASFKGTTTNLDSMDGYIKWGNASTEKIQFRSFGGEASLTGWQGEIKGASANQGKVSLGPINYILKRHGLDELPSSQESAKLAEENSEKHAENISKMMLDYGIITNSELSSTTKEIQKKSNKYRYSKYLVLKLLLIMEKTTKDKADEVVKDMYLYASSQASFSAPYVKLE
jgi:hypothetical protein